MNLSQKGKYNRYWRQIRRGVRVGGLYVRKEIERNETSSVGGVISKMYHRSVMGKAPRGI